MISAPECLESTHKLTNTRASYEAAANLLDGYIYEARFLRDDDSPDNRIIWASEGFNTVFGFSVDEYNQATAWGRFYHEEELRGAIERARALRRGEIVEAEIRVSRGTGEIRWLYLKNRPVFEDGGERVIGVLGIGQDITSRKQSEASLRALEREVIEVSNRERQRIASDLHDGLGQDLTGIAMMLRSITERHARGSTDIAASLEEVIVLVNRSIHEARTLANGLAPLEIGHEGLAGALQSLAIHTREISGVDVRFNRTGRLNLARLIPVAENQMYCIAREALYNALRHSGARSISISLRPYRGGMLLRVNDNGCGFRETRSPTAGMGMRIMDYRARTIEAKLVVKSRPQFGTSIFCYVPTLSSNKKREEGTETAYEIP